MNYKQAITYLESFIDYERRAQPPLRSPFRLDRMRALLSSLGPTHELFKSVHIAGTNGKGSTAAMTASILAEAGLKTGLYTSPHLITFRERIRVNGKMITEKETAAVVSTIKDALSERPPEGGSPSFFEVYTSACFLFFADQKVDFAVVETGLGGRLDATNVIIPELCVLTPIGMDHTRELGNTLGEIALEKCGIIKKGVPLITAGQEEEAREVILRAAAEKGSALTEVLPEGSRGKSGPADRTFFIKTRHSSPTGNVFSLITDEKTYDELESGLNGRQQAVNGGLAAAAAISLGIKEKAVRQGLKKALLPGRLQYIPGKKPVLLDGGHNPPAARNLAEYLSSHFKNSKVILVFGVSQDKDYEAIAREIFPGADKVILTRSSNPRAAPPEMLAEKLAGYAADMDVVPAPEQAMERALEESGEQGLVCVAGSFFLVGEILELMRKRKDAHGIRENILI